MRWILLSVVMLLIAAPAMATVNIKARTAAIGDAGNDKCSCVAVEYNCTAGEKIRAFSLEVTVDNNYIIQAVRDFNVGESNRIAPRKLGYGIFPGSFGKYINAADPCWTDPCYSPACPNTFADANGTGKGTNKIITELGSLYVAGDEPCSTGTLFRIDVIPKTWPSECNVTLAVNSTRGGVVNTNGDPCTPSLTGCKVTYTKCFPCWAPWNLVYANQWTPQGEPNCWCYPRQCHGDADGKKQGTSTKTGYWYVGSNDVAILQKAYLVYDSPRGPGMKGEPNICADFARDKQGTSTKTGYWRVGSNDLALLSAYYLVYESPRGPSTPPDCGGIINP